jgi:hypothetical protein
MAVRVPAFHEFAIAGFDRGGWGVPSNIQHAIGMRQIFDFAFAWRHEESVSEWRGAAAFVGARRDESVIVSCVVLDTAAGDRARRRSFVALLLRMTAKAVWAQGLDG